MLIFSRVVRLDSMFYGLVAIVVSGLLFASNLAGAADVTDTPAAPVVSISAEDVANGKRDIVVAISAGHGGDDPGAIGIDDLLEKDVVLAIAQRIFSILDKAPGFRPVLIRDEDYYIGLRQRIEIAHQQEADLFIAIHADAADTPFAQGVTVYALSTKGATSEQASRLASKENSADLIGGVSSVSLRDKPDALAITLLGLAFNGSIAISLEIGDVILAALDKVTATHRSKVEQAAFLVLKSADIPSLLIETGYITNLDDARNLNSADHQVKLANAIVEGITDYFYSTPPIGTWVFWQKQNSDLQREYIVRAGDNLSLIAERFHISMSSLMVANQLSNTMLAVGQTLLIPVIQVVN